MRKVWCVPVLLAAVTACAQKPGATAYTDTAPQVVDGAGAVGGLYRGGYDGVTVDYELIGRSFESDGKLGLCALVRVMAPRDVSATMRQSMALDRSVVELGKKGGDTKLSVPARFLDVRYVQGSSGDISTLARAGFADKRPGPCVVLNHPWDEQWRGHNLSLSLHLYSRDTRQRSQTVVGDAGAAP